MCQEETQKPRWIVNLSRICRPDRKFLDGSKKLSTSYRDTVQKFSMDQESDKICRDKKKKGLIDANLSRICREAVELKEKVFSRKGKTHRDKCNKQATKT